MLKHLLLPTMLLGCINGSTITENTSYSTTCLEHEKQEIKLVDNVKWSSKSTENKQVIFDKHLPINDGSTSKSSYCNFLLNKSPKFVHENEYFKEVVACYNETVGNNNVKDLKMYLCLEEWRRDSTNKDNNEWVLHNVDCGDFKFQPNGFYLKTANNFFKSKTNRKQVVFSVGKCTTVKK